MLSWKPLKSLEDFIKWKQRRKVHVGTLDTSLLQNMLGEKIFTATR